MDTSKNSQLLQTLMECIAACENCMKSCLQEEHVKEMKDCILLDIDCAEICTLTARFVSRGSAHAKHVMKECIEICRLCAEECSRHDHDHCQQCAEACRKCADACQDYL